MPRCPFHALYLLTHRLLEGNGLSMPWPQTCPKLKTAAAAALDTFELLAEDLLQEVIVQAGLDPDDEVFARHCRPMARRADLGSVDIDSSPLV